MRCDTTNPASCEQAPGERDLVEELEVAFSRGGLETEIYFEQYARPNLLVTIAGTAPIDLALLSMHLDVVPAVGTWQHPPFRADIAESAIWGRGAIDMKGPIAAYLAALARLTLRAGKPTRGIRLCFFADEENGSELGAESVVREAPHWFENVSFAIGEPSISVFEHGDRVFAPIQVAEKRGCWCRVVVRAPGGHASYPQKDGVITKLQNVLAALSTFRMPASLSKTAARSIDCLLDATDAQDFDREKARADVLSNPPGPMAATFTSSLSITGIQSGDGLNSHPTTATIFLDVRLQPHLDAQLILGQLRNRLAEESAELIVDFVDPVAEAESDDVFELLSGSITRNISDSVPIPILAPGASDARFLASAGIDCFGFPPLDLRESGPSQLAHAIDERIPLKSLDLATSCVETCLEDLCWGSP